MKSGSIAAVPWSRTIVVAIIWTCAPGTTWAVQGVGVRAEPIAHVSGEIRDETGASVEGASLSLFGLSSGFERATRSAADGSFVFPFVPPGTYVLRVLCHGFAPVEVRDFAVSAHDRLSFSIRVQIASIAERVDVVGHGSATRHGVVQPLAVRGGTVEVVQIAGDVQRTIPLSSRRDWADALRLTPGIVRSADATGLARFHWRGSDATSHVLQIDGADMGSAVEGETVYINLSPEAVDHVVVNDASLDATTPNAFGTVVNVVTRSGSNQLAGVAAWRYQDRSWNGHNLPGGTSASTSLADVEAAAGGPLRPDRAWYFAAARTAQRTMGISRTPEQLALLEALVPTFRPFDDASRERSVFVKATARSSAVHQWSAFYEHDMRPEGANGALNAGKFATRRFGGSGASVRFASAWRDRLTTQVAVAYNDKSAPSVAMQHRSSRPVHQEIVQSGGFPVGTGAVAILDNVASSVERPRQKLIVAADLSYQAERGWGSHDLFTGLYVQPLVRDRVIERFVNDGVTLDEHVLRDPFNPGLGTVSFHRKTAEDALLDIKSRGYAAYVQDRWRLAGGLTVHAGIRVDAIRRHAKGVEGPAPGVPLVSGQLQQSVEIAPRVGVTYRPGTGDPHVITAGWGRLHEAGFSGGALATVSSTTTTDRYDANLDGSFESIAIAGPRRLIPAADRLPYGDLHQPYANEWLLSHRWQPRPGLAVGGSFARRTYRDRLGLVETNARYEGGQFVGYTPFGRREGFLLTNNIWNWPVVLDVELQVSRQRGRLQLLGTYGRQWRHIAGGWQPNDPAAVLQPDAFANNKGIGSLHGSRVAALDANSLSGTSMTDGVQWRDHVLAVSGSWLAPAGISIATAFSLQTGPWSGPIVSRLPSGAAEHPDTIVVPGLSPGLSPGITVLNPLATPIRFAHATRGEGQFALPMLQTWNVRVGYERRYGRGRVQAAVDLLNLLNHGGDELHEIGANQTFNPNFRRSRVRQPPRAAQISIRFAF